MTPDELRAIRERCEAATPGPWEPNEWVNDQDGGWAAIGPHHESRECNDDEPESDLHAMAKRDAAFIAAARTDVPALLDEVERLYARITEHQRKFEAGWDVLRKQRDEARAEVQQLSDERDELLVRVADQEAELRATREAYNGARTDVERLSDASTHWQVMLKRETEEVERLERELQIERMGIRPIDEVRCAAYRRGAEAMRDECIGAACGFFMGTTGFCNGDEDELEAVLEALPIPEEP